MKNNMDIILKLRTLIRFVRPEDDQTETEKIAREAIDEIERLRSTINRVIDKIDTIRSAKLALETVDEDLTKAIYRE